jgi:hypothetical protein
LQGAYLPAETLIVAWINAQGWLVGAGNPLPLGAIRANRRRRSPGQGAYAAISLIASSRDPSEAPIHAAVLSASVYGMTDENAEAAAVAYANLLDQTDGQPVNLGTATLLIADSITGPLYSPDGDEHRYLVDATCHLTPI